MHHTIKLIFGFTLWLSVSLVHAAVFFVNVTDIDAIDANPGDGICDIGFGTNQCTLRAAIMEANEFPGVDTISLILPGQTINLTIPPAGVDTAASGDLDITETVFVLGVAGTPAMRPTINASHGDRIFEIGANNVVVSGLRLSGGTVSGSASGGAIHISSADNVSIEKTEIFNSSAEQSGGAISAFFSSATLTEVDLHNNGTAGFGAALVVNASDVTLASSSIRNNISLNLDANQSSAINAGGVGLLTLHNSTISGNDGNGIRIGSSSLSARNTTIINNDIRGIFFLTGADRTLFLRNVALSGNGTAGCETLGPVAGTISTNGHNFSNDAGCQLDQASNLIEPGALLGPLQIGPDEFTAYHIPQPSSPLIDNGHPVVGGTGCLATDQRGTDRPVDGDNDGIARCDIGAIEAGLHPSADQIFSTRFQNMESSDQVP